MGTLSWQALYQEASELVTQQQWPQAEELLRKVLELQPAHAAAHHLLGRVLLERGDRAQALLEQQHSCALNPWLGWNWFKAGELLMAQQRWNEAVEAFGWALHALPAESWMVRQWQEARALATFQGERLVEGLGSQTYQYWIRHHEPRLPDPLIPLLQQFWWIDGKGCWRALHGTASLIPKQAPLGDSPWPQDGWFVLLHPRARLRLGALQALEQWLYGPLPWPLATQFPSVSHGPQRNKGDLPDLIYADEDRLDADGRRYDPWLKPGWVPESFWGNPWLTHFSVWRLDWLRQQRLPLPPVDDLGRFQWTLLALEKQPKIEACPLVLVHQLGDQSAPGTSAEKASALCSHLQRLGESVQRVLPLSGPSGGFQLQWTLPRAVRCSVLIPTRDRSDLLSCCLESLWVSTSAERAKGIELEVLVLDNGSVEGETAQLLQHWKQRLGGLWSTIRVDEPFNWSRLNNIAASQAKGDLLLCLNNDIEARQPGWLLAMVTQALRPVVGCVGSNLLYPDGTLQHAGVVLGFRGGAEHAYRQLPLDHGIHRGRSQLLTGWGAVTGACLMLRRELLLNVGGFDEALPVEFNDVDLCLRLGSLGYRHVIPPEAVLIHHESQSRDAQGSATAHTALRRVQGRWAGRLRSGSPWWPAQAELHCVDGRPLGLAHFDSL